MNKRVLFGLLVATAVLLTGCFHVTQAPQQLQQPAPAATGSIRQTEGRGSTSLFDSNDYLDPALEDLEATE